MSKHTPAETENQQQQLEFIDLHVLCKNVQSIRQQERLDDFLTEIDVIEFDLAFVSETWRDDDSECMVTQRGHKLYLAGSGGHCGVGIAVSHTMLQKSSHFVLHSLTSRVSVLYFDIRGKRFAAIACYLPTSWDTTEAVEGCYVLLQFVLESCRATGRTPILQCLRWPSFAAGHY